MKAPFEVPEDQGLFIDDDYFCKTQDGLRAVLTGLRTFGYTVSGLRYDRLHHKSLTVPQLELEVVPLWHCKLPGVYAHQCRSCKSIIDDTGLDAEGRVCEFCGVPTRAVLGTQLPEESLPHYSQVMFWRGDVYPMSGEGRLPYPDSVMAYEAWRWAPLAPGPDLAGHVLRIGNFNSRRDWYHHGEHRPGMADHIADMTTFVTNFTTLEPAHWREVMADLPTNPTVHQVYDAVTRLCV